mmetsp:Transcript_30501/g.30158  ORF Transcript_30501/g.30158 Transcript_30501/m.30158 type:complete len:242 (+) Transcript_30501:363-1088(+)
MKEDKLGNLITHINKEATEEEKGMSHIKKEAREEVKGMNTESHIKKEAKEEVKGMSNVSHIKKGAIEDLKGLIYIKKEAKKEAKGMSSMSHLKKEVIEEAKGVSHIKKEAIEEAKEMSIMSHIMKEDIEEAEIEDSTEVAHTHLQIALRTRRLQKKLKQVLKSRKGPLVQGLEEIIIKIINVEADITTGEEDTEEAALIEIADRLKFMKKNNSKKSKLPIHNLIISQNTSQKPKKQPLPLL